MLLNDVVYVLNGPRAVYNLELLDNTVISVLILCFPCRIVFTFFYNSISVKITLMKRDLFYKNKKKTQNRVVLLLTCYVETEVTLG